MLISPTNKLIRNDTVANPIKFDAFVREMKIVFEASGGNVGLKNSALAAPLLLVLERLCRY